MRTLKWDPMFDPASETTIAVWIWPPPHKTRPACARVKVEVDLLKELPKRINVGIKKKTGEVISKWIQIKYDYLPKYCCTCKLQGHNEDNCYVLHPELFDGDKKKQEDKKDPRPKTDQVDTSTKFQTLEGQKEVDANPKTNNVIAQTPEQVQQKNSKKINTKKWVEQNFVNELRDKTQKIPKKDNEVEKTDSKTPNKSVQVSNQHTQGSPVVEKVNMDASIAHTGGDVHSTARKQVNTLKRSVIEVDKDGEEVQSQNKGVAPDTAKEELAQATATQEGKQVTTTNSKNGGDDDDGIEEDMRLNIKDVAKSGDLSPRSIRDLNKEKRKGRPANSRNSQIQTASTPRLINRGPQEIDFYRRRIRMANATVNCSGKIWLFWTDVWDREIISDTIQQITIKFTHNVTKQQALITAVYARCSDLERLELWEDIRWIADACSVPWVVGGDFNVVLNDSEKLGGLPVCQMETTDFAHCISDLGLTEFPFSGNLYTW
ncbi:hypothetical protein H5410_015442 [Solanum commersonii]|uniref:DUF4283 domain-containing protein n=1 Tax=Solanum commersonii TaxID=4109 RepID=A0A9J5ZUE2_SOLCO|nr:hypothetical protein H5410_015442 [Solanum commersonii]